MSKFYRHLLDKFPKVEQWVAFVCFLWKRLRDDNCLETAGALAYTTLFALVPMIAAILGILSAFPVFQEWRTSVTDFIFANFVPGAARAVQGYLTQFAEHATKTTAAGILVLLFSVLMVMANIEDAYNRIWRVTNPRRKTARFLMYWAALTLGPLVIVAVLAVSSYLFALPLLSHVSEQFDLHNRLLALLPFFITWLALAGSYFVVPNRSQPLRHAVLGGLLAALLFELAKHGFAYYLGTLTSYQQVYGALAVIPIFLLWIYLSWLIVLLGASFAASLSAFDYRAKNARLPVGYEFIGLLAVLAHFVEAHRAGIGLHSDQLRQRTPFLTEDLLCRYLADLQRTGVVQRTEQGTWVVARELASVTLLELYEAGNYRLPLTMSGENIKMLLSNSNAVKWMIRNEQILHSLLDHPLSEILPVEEHEDMATEDLFTSIGGKL